MNKKILSIASLVAMTMLLSPASGLAQDKCAPPEWVSFQDPAYYWGLGEAKVEKDLSQAKEQAYQNAAGELAKMVGQTITASITDIQKAQGRGKKTIEEFTVVSEVKAIAEHHLSGITPKGEWLNPCLKTDYVLVVISREEANRQVKDNANQATNKELQDLIRQGIQALEARVQDLEEKYSELQKKYGGLVERLARLEEAAAKETPETGTGAGLATAAQQVAAIRRDMQAGKPYQEVEQDLTAAEWYQKAHDLNEQATAVEGEKHGRLNEVISLYTKALEINPKYAAAYNNRGVAYNEQGHYDQAIVDCNKALEIEPKYAMAYINRGISYGKQGHYDQAIADFNKALEINPNYAYAYNNRGISYGKQGHYDRAIADFNKALEINPKSAAAYINRGNAYNKQGHYDQAIVDLNKAMEINPKYGDAYIMRASTYRKQGQYDQAIADYNKALEINPKDDYAYNDRGNAYDEQGRYDQAIADYNKALEINPKFAAAFNNRGNAYYHQGHYDRAIADYNKALEINPKDADAYFNRGIVYNEQGRYDQAIADYNKAIKLSPENYQSYNGLSWLYSTCPITQYRDGSKAVELATQAGKLNNWEWDPIWDTLAAAYAEAGNFVKAIEYEEKALSLPGSEKYKDDFQRRLELYRSGKPYRENPAEQKKP